MEINRGIIIDVAKKGVNSLRSLCRGVPPQIEKEATGERPKIVYEYIDQIYEEARPDNEIVPDGFVVELNETSIPSLKLSATLGLPGDGTYTLESIMQLNRELDYLNFIGLAIELRKHAQVTTRREVRGKPVILDVFTNPSLDQPTNVVTQLEYDLELPDSLKLTLSSERGREQLPLSPSFEDFAANIRTFGKANFFTLNAFDPRTVNLPGLRFSPVF